MRIGIISDTHGEPKGFEKAIKIIGDADAIIHCGDILCSYRYCEDVKPIELAQKISAQKNIFLAKGNGDNMEDEKFLQKNLNTPALILELGDYKIFATHGHQYSRMQMIMKAKEQGANILCCGHSHIKELDSDEEMIIINPGSTSLPRDGSSSCAVIEDHIAKIYHLETGELIAQLAVPKRKSLL